MTGKAKRNIIVVSVLVVLVVITLAVYSAYHFTSGALARERRLYLAAGGTATLREAVGERPADEDNAALLYEAAFFLLPNWEQLNEGEQDLFISPLTAIGEPIYSTGEAAAFIDKHGEALGPIRNATELSDCYWSTRYEIGVGALLPNLGGGRQAAKLLAVEAVARVEAGDAVGAVQSLVTMLELADDVGSEPTVMNHLTQIAMERYALGLLEDLFRAREVPTGTDLDEVLAQRDHRARLARALRTQGASALVSAENGTLAAYADQPGGPIDEVLSVLLRKRDLALFLKRCRGDAEHYGQPIHEQGSPPARDEPGWAVITSGLSSASGVVNQAIARGEAVVALARSALQLREVRRETGDYPDRFEAMTDPFTGEPLQYERTPTGFILRSAGEDEDSRPLEWRWE
jgi:hypothetical protein